MSSISQPASLLVVDDNPVVLAATAGLLVAAGYRVLEAGSCAEALATAREQSPDLVLLDVVLPDGSGVDLCREIKRAPELANTFVVLFSSSEVSADRQASGLDAGADGYIARPIDHRELVARVHSLVRIQQAEAALRRAHAELERRVEERTAALARANAALVEEVDERIAAENTLREYAQRLRLQHEIDQAILAAQSATEIADAALSRSRALLGWTRACVAKLDAECSRAVILAAYHGSDRLPARSVALSDADLQRLGAVLSVDAQPMAAVASLIGESAEPGAITLRVPLVAEGKLIGVMELLGGRAIAFPPDQVEFATEIAAQLAVALQQAQLFAQVSESRERLRALSLRLVQVQEAERRFIASELHDQIGQALTGLKLSMDVLLPQVAPHLQGTIQESTAALSDLMARVRRLSLDLRPPMLDDLGLVPALEWHFRRFTSQTGIRVDFKRGNLPARISSQVETAAYRLVQEALTNVARYAHVTEAAVRMWADDVRVRLQIEDRGSGFDPAAVLSQRASNGIAGMRERVELLGGNFLVESTPGGGTRITAELPLQFRDLIQQGGEAI